MFPLILIALILSAGSPAIAQEAPEAPSPEPAEASQVPEADEGETDEAAEPDPEAEGDERDDDGFTISISERRGSRRYVTKDTQIHFGTDLEIAEDEVARDAIVIMGSLHVYGRVIGDAVSILGPVTIDGEVTGDVASVGGTVYLGANADVTGDIVSIGGSVERHPDARVLGEITEVDFGPTVNWSGLPMFWTRDGSQLWNLWHLGVGWSIFWTLFKWALMMLLVSLVFVVAREPVERTGRQLRAEPWKSSLLGLVTLVFFPFLFATVCVILAITIIGIPLLIVVVPLVILLLIFALLLGYTSASYSVGTWMVRRFGWSTTSPYAALVIGVLTIQSLSLLAALVASAGGVLWFFAMIFGLAGWFVRFLAWTSGFGAALLTQLGRRDPIGDGATTSLPPTPTPAAAAGAVKPVAPAAAVEPARPVAPSEPADAPTGGDSSADDE